MAVRFRLTEELFVRNPSPDENAVTITEEGGKFFLNIHIKIEMEGTKVPATDPSPAEQAENKRKCRESRSNEDNLLVRADGCGVKIEKTDFTDATGASILRLVARVKPKVPHTGGLE